jgi:hypothetical protein
MRKPRKPKPELDSEALKKEQEESGRPATPPAREAIGRAEYPDADLLSEELDGAGEGKPMPDHDDEL